MANKPEGELMFLMSCQHKFGILVYFDNHKKTRA